MAFHGFVDNPMFVSRNNGGGMRWTAEYPRFTAFGTSFAKGFGSQTVRGEVAYSRVFRYRASVSPGRSVAGRPRLGLRHRQQVLPEPPAFRGRSGRVGSFRQPDMARRDPEISGKWFRDALKTGGPGQTLHQREGTLTEVFLEYELDDHWKASTGVMFWTGGRTPSSANTRTTISSMTLRYAF